MLKIDHYPKVLVAFATALFAVAAVGGGCAQNEDKSPPVPPSATQERPKADLDLPKTTSGNYLLIDTGNARIELNPKKTLTPLDTKLGCGVLLAGCSQPSTTTNRIAAIDACVANVARCSTQEPWTTNEQCCPDLCVSSYLAQRESNVTPMVAFTKAFNDSSCYPGLRQYMKAQGVEP